MSLRYRFSCLPVFLLFALSGAAMGAAEDQAGRDLQHATARIRLDERSMIVIPVRINGSGSYDFLLDTGASKSIIDRKLADQLGLARTGEKTVVGVLGSARMAIVHVDSLAVGEAMVGGGEMFSSDDRATVNGKVRGVLGEDFLQNFDVLIDYRHQSIRLEPPLSSMAQMATGERLPLQLNGMCHGKPTRNRLLVSGHIEEFGDATMLLLLDSGANQLTLFREKADSGLNQSEPIRMGNFNQWVGSTVDTRRIRSLSLGNHSVSDLTVVTLSRRAEVDSDGLVPTSLFHSILISSQGGFVILDPSFPKTSREEQVAAAR